MPRKKKPEEMSKEELYEALVTSQKRTIALLRKKIVKYEEIISLKEETLNLREQNLTETTKQLDSTKEYADKLYAILMERDQQINAMQMYMISQRSRSHFPS